MWLWERRPILDWWKKDTCKNYTLEKYCAHARLCTYTLLQICRTAKLSNQRDVCCLCVHMYVSVVFPVITRWPLVYLDTRKRWSLTHCLQGWSRASSTANAPLMVGSGRLFCSKRWSSTSDALSPTTLSCSVAWSRSESGNPSVFSEARWIWAGWGSCNSSLPAVHSSTNYRKKPSC